MVIKLWLSMAITFLMRGRNKHMLQDVNIYNKPILLNIIKTIILGKDLKNLKQINYLIVGFLMILNIIMIKMTEKDIKMPGLWQDHYFVKK